MQNKKESGFSLIELLLVVVMIGVISTIAIPYLIRGISAAENGNMYATMRVVISSQMSFYAQNNRFGRLDEINAINSSLGTVSGTSLTRGKFTLVLSPDPNPSDADLKSSYTVIATKPANATDPGYQITADQTGRIY